MKRYFIELSFKGTNYHGWQIQDNAHTVQAELNSALKNFLGKEIETLGVGRTDTGVHATQFFVQFDFEKEIPDKMVHSLNGMLPGDIAVKRVFPVAKGANVRFDAVSRTYEYWVYQQKNPFLKENACFFPFEMDLKLVNEASDILREYKDFKCFSKSNTQVKTTHCDVFSAGWKTYEDNNFGEKIVFTISANRFLRNMVRAIVGTIFKVAKNEITLGDFRKIIETGGRADAGMSVPACGLYLTKIEYNREKISAND